LEHYARGNYLAAEIDAQNLERLAKARFGAEHPYYAVALNKLGIVSDRLSKLGSKGLVAHGLRTTFAVHFTELGVPTEYLQRLLGHKRIQQSAEAESVNAELMNLKAFEIMRKKAA
jgi:integrase